ncbi:hypothetical protein LU293_09495 [Moraxella nasovis]|uniref:hypothetical protein n=1 Tax=Moraxella nasovis TaxID=2904121 RepID=UPI001F607BDB|nr:hypothetical protein [Moraxella nasovis]UNU73283.1 hypothetical protein LU293_09495 [Moraxella nasovis]
MTETTQTPTTLNRTEAQVLQGFISQVDYWQMQHGEKADTVEIIYYPDDEGFDVFNGEENNELLKRNRTTVFRADILAWASNQLKNLQGWNNDKTVTAFTLSFKNGEYGVLVDVADKSAEPPQTDRDGETDETASEN